MNTSTPAYYPVLVALIGTLAACAPVQPEVVGTRDRGQSTVDGTGGATETDGSTLPDDDTETAGFAGCTADDLLWEAFVLDHDGQEVDRLAPGASMTLVGLVENPCDHDVEVDVDTTCLIQGFEVVDRITGDGDYQERSCPLTGSSIVLRPGDVEEARHTWDEVPAGDYDLAVHFAIHGLLATTSLLVE